MNAPRFEIVQTDAGWHSRSIAENGQVVLTSEVYTRRAAARNAIRITAQLFSITPVFFDEKDGAMYVNAAGMQVELRDVDERPLRCGDPAPHDAHTNLGDGRPCAGGAR